MFGYTQTYTYMHITEIIEKIWYEFEREQGGTWEYLEEGQEREK